MPHHPALVSSFLALPPLARANRKALTASEFVLWSALRGSQLGGVKFRRQHVLAPFIVDFYAAGCQLVVEIDGSVHSGREARDASRTVQLVKLHGVRVVRFSEAAVMLEMPRVLAALRAAVA